MTKHGGLARLCWTLYVVTHRTAACSSLLELFVLLGASVQAMLGSITTFSESMIVCLC